MTPPGPTLPPPAPDRSGRGGTRRGAAAGASRTPVVLLLLAATTALVFSPVVRHLFLPEFDDGLYVVGNPWVLRGLSPESIRWAFTTAEVAFWCPVTLLSHMLDVELFGLHPAGHHLTSVLVHVGATAALFLALRGMTGAPGRSAVVAALFAIHPLHVESVAWVSERKDVLCGLFWCLGLVAYGAYARRPSLPRYGAVAASFAAALMSKSMAVTFPFALLLLDAWPLGRLRPAVGPAAPGRGAVPRYLPWVEKIPLLLPIPLVALLSYRAQIAIGGVSAWREYEFGDRVANALASYAGYLGTTLFPRGLAAYYPHPGPAVPLRAALAGGLLLLLVTAGCARLLRTRPHLMIGWLWYLGVLVPVIGLVQIGQFAMADRFTYLPLVGVFVAATWETDALGSRWRVGAPRRAAAALAVLAAFGTMAWMQAGFWRDTVTLLTHTVEVTGDNEAARTLLGRALARQGELDRAAAQFREVLRINDNTVAAMDGLADVLDRQGDPGAARELRARARSLETAFAAAQSLSVPPGPGPGGPGPREYNNAGVGEARRGRYREAEAHFRRALALDPGYAGAHLNLGVLLQERGDAAAARAAYRRALGLDPGLKVARERLAALDAAGAGAPPR